MHQPISAFFAHGRTYSPSALVTDDDAAVRDYPHLFSPIESATAAPGEKRASKRTAKKAAAAPVAEDDQDDQDE